MSKPTADERLGMSWWNGLSTADRITWMARADSAAVADAWQCYKTWAPTWGTEEDFRAMLDKVSRPGS